ncbi:MAG: hypothetical protein FJW31_30265 [Acidobacteria bacterium]|nr:hypothetical protein [Acidobacteriota bacterium]
MPKLDRRNFLRAGGTAPLAAPAAQQAAASPGSAPRPYRLIYNDDGGGASMWEPPLTPRQFVDATIAQIAGTRVDALSWPIGMNGLYVMNYPTRVPGGEVVGDSLREDTGVKLESSRWWRNISAVRSLIEQGHDPMKLMVDGAHGAGIDIWIHIRQNDWHHVRGESTADPQHFLNFMAGRFWREHPEWRIGKEGLEGWPEGQPVSEAAMDFQDFAHEPVRRYRIAIAEEVASRYDVDGIELDFMRCPYFFKKAQVPAMTGVMTDYVREIRRTLDRLGRQRGRYIGLSARVPWTVAGAAAVGLDAPRWAREGLVNQLVPSPFFAMALDADVSEWIALGKRTGCRIYPCIEESFRAGIANEGGVPGLQWVSLEHARAAAMNFWRSGADGIYLFNWPDRGRNVNTSPGLNELHDPSVLRRKNKRYAVGRRNTKGAGSWPYCELPRVIPASLQRGQPVRVNLPVADDLAAERERIASVRLCLLFENLTGADKVHVTLNGAAIQGPANPIRPGQHIPHATVGGLFTWQYFDLAQALPRSGDNAIEVGLAARNSDFEKPWSRCELVLSDVELEIKYRWPGADWTAPRPGESES